MARTRWSATEFLDTLATEATRSNYRSGLKLYFGITTVEKLPARNYENQLNIIAQEYLNSDPDYEKDFAKFHAELKKNYAPKTVQLRLLPIRGFLEINGITPNQPRF